MSFFNFPPSSDNKIKCLYCTEDTKLRYVGKNRDGKLEYYDEIKDCYHICKPELLKTIECKYCKKKDFKWDKRDGKWVLVSKEGYIHKCDRKKPFISKPAEYCMFCKLTHSNIALECKHPGCKFKNIHPKEIDYCLKYKHGYDIEIA